MVTRRVEEQWATLINQVSPNSTMNINTLCIFDGDERTHNLKAAIDIMKLKEEVAKWKQDGIRGKKVKEVIWSGDLQFLPFLMGHAGCS